MKGRDIHIPQAVAAPIAGPRSRTTDACALPRDPATRKLRALWISAFHLGLTCERSDDALVAWLHRQRGMDADSAASPAALARAASALEAWLARAAGVDWRPHLSLGRDGRVRETRRPRARVLEAQWRLLHRRGLVRIGSIAALSAYAARHAGLGRVDSHLALPDAQADALIRHLGKRLRAARAGDEHGAEAPAGTLRSRRREARLNRRRAQAQELADVFASTSE